MTTEELNREFNLRTKLLMALYKNKVFGFKEVQDAIHSYYKNPAATLKKFGVIS